MEPYPAPPPWQMARAMFASIEGGSIAILGGATTGGMPLARGGGIKTNVLHTLVALIDEHGRDGEVRPNLRN
jgi:hypothetical protein